MEDKYTVVEESNLVDLITEVNVLIQEGYHPIGQVNKIVGSYLQAMYLHTDSAGKSIRSVHFHDLYFCSEG